MKKRTGNVLLFILVFFVSGIAGGCTGNKKEPFEGTWVSDEDDKLTFSGGSFTMTNSDGDEGTGVYVYANGYIFAIAFDEDGDEDGGAIFYYDESSQKLSLNAAGLEFTKLPDTGRSVAKKVTISKKPAIEGTWVSDEDDKLTLTFSGNNFTGTGFYYHAGRINVKGIYAYMNRNIYVVIPNGDGYEDDDTMTFPYDESSKKITFEGVEFTRLPNN
ncbi:MAG: hypothetical protein LBQ88_17595 [Treponema sp.]|jgi:hypothetical protein|nr:hypothetical protein [Treponema sp.]